MKIFRKILKSRHNFQSNGISLTILREIGDKIGVFIRTYKNSEKFDTINCTVSEKTVVRLTILAQLINSRKKIVTSIA